MAKITQKNHKNHKSHNFFKNNILSDSLPTKYTLQSRLKNLYMYCTVFFARFSILPSFSLRTSRLSLVKFESIFEQYWCCPLLQRLA